MSDRLFAKGALWPAFSALFRRQSGHAYIGAGLFVPGLPGLHRRVFLAGPLSVRPGIGPRFFIAENLQHDGRERRPRTAVSIGVDLKFRGDAPRREESM